MKPFIHLHVHSQFSVLDGQASIDALVDKAMSDGMPGLALTDHGNMFGVKEMFNYIKKKKGKLKDEKAKLEKQLAEAQESGDAEKEAALKNDIDKVVRKINFK